MSKVSRAQAQLNRARVVETAARLFRERGFDGVGIVDVMNAAGLTHGGFYAQFPSKDHLMAEACSKASDDLHGMWRDMVGSAPLNSLSVLTADYLSQEHRDHPGSGCIAASLGADSAHQAPIVRATFTASIKRTFESLMQVIPGRSAKSRRRQGIARFSAMVGGVILARSVGDAALSDEILDAVRAHIAEMDKARTA